MKLLKKVIITAVLCIIVAAGLFAEVKSSAATLKKDAKYHIEYYDENKVALSLTSSAVTFKNTNGAYKMDDFSFQQCKSCKFKVNKNTKFFYENVYKGEKKAISRTKVRKMFKNKFSDFFGDSWGVMGAVVINIEVKNGVASEIVITPGYMP